ncbi:MAG: hypothetical protein ACE5J2_07135 [Nitrososphaerales archaeon]
MGDQIEELLRDLVIIKIIKIIDRASLSILELLELGITRKEINHCLAMGVLIFDKAPVKATNDYGAVAGGDYYFDFLNSKVKLSETGSCLLKHIRQNG